ncbi:ExeM/NucH family extracellular endonuclease [Modestobacter sp. I12A-02628]|uniref:ExeM/NucH family extracellular endonuclease n=1 Tax=Goekera deserti TaxID=2497753 RepID=A0A7K3WG62_9ACTN|nr:ExeM/NucH family extracellular endonuclease [Goekera deserti]MPQ96771.1 ExeM/NucH family extracellular endonuclease [Goekera deserti]NDI46915.1 ExeM/NucH family extracellular endonuclease [Goekera deserti]NEL54483.1 ExeM/NucH family extracellular endonuclease [Goekera deserti]
MSTRITRPAVLGAVVGSLAAGGLAVAAPASAVSPDVVINEVYGGGGNSGATLRNDFIELANRSTAPVDVTGWSVQYASAVGTSWQVTPLTGTIPAGGTYLVQQAAGTGGTTDLPTPDATGSIAMGAGAGKVALSTGSAALTCGTACAGTATVRDLVGYGSTAVGGEGAPVTPNPSSTTSAARTAGPDTDVNSTDFTVGAPTPTAGGTVTPPVDPEPPVGPACDAAVATIGSVQGTGAATAVTTPVTVRGTVVGDVQDGGLDGFYVQDAGDGDAATSDGVFVYAPGGAAVDLGDVVTVTGTPAEFNGQTQLGGTRYVECGIAPQPAATALPLPSTDAQREALEGMLVAPPAGLTVTELFNLDRFGETQLAQGGRLLTPTEAAETGAPAEAVAAANAARSILLDDARTARLDTGGQAPPYLTVDDPVRVGDTAVLQPTVLGYGFGTWRLQPADGSADGTTFTPTNPRPAAPPAVGGDLRVADFNVLNYFVTFGGNSRGAPDAAELAQQQAKIVTALTALDADVITLHEIENSSVTTPATPYRAVETLLAALSAADGNTWDYVRASEDTDVITNAIVYRTDEVTPVGGPQVPADLSVFANARTPIAQTFDADGEVFTIVANHLKSKGSSCGAGSDVPDTAGGNCNGDRVAQARALADFAGRLATSTGDPDVLLTGDFNAYRYEDPIDVLTAAGFTDLGPVLAEGQYSYVFGGGSGSLDHVLASRSIVPKITDLAVWDINAVESPAYEYGGYEPLYAPYAYRSSDHNPTVFGIDTDTPATAAVSSAAATRGDVVTVTGTAFDNGEQVTATFPGEPNKNRATLGTAVAGVDGVVRIQYTVPQGFRKGTYPVLLTGATGEQASTSIVLDR